MPRKGCSVCVRPDVEAINAAYQAGEPVRAIARRLGFSAASADRHFHHAEREQNRVNAGELARINAEIRKLHLAQTNARKRRDNTLALAIAKELRNWFLLKRKAQIASIGAAKNSEDAQQMSPAEALALARAVIEGALDDASVRAWIVSLAERVGQSAPAQDADEG